MWESRRRGGFSLENSNGKRSKSSRNRPTTVANFGMMWQYNMPSLPEMGYLICFIFRSHADLNELLDSNKDRDKLEAMRRIIEVCFASFSV